MNEFSHLRHAAASDVGRKRTNNEDAYGCWPESGLFCVADGMGGGDDGEIASAAVIRALDSIASALAPADSGAFPAGTVMDTVSAAVDAASAWIHTRAARRSQNVCGSTFVGVCFDAADPSRANALHAGDSRLYRLRGGEIVQITRDHSAAEMIGARDEREINPMFRGMILRSVGMGDRVELERTPLDIASGDRLILCSDGLYRMVEPDRMAALSRDCADADTAAAALVAAANEAGGVDNITAIVIDVGALPPPCPARTDGETPAPPDTAGLDGAFSVSETVATVTDEISFCGEVADEGIDGAPAVEKTATSGGFLRWLWPSKRREAK